MEKEIQPVLPFKHLKIPTRHLEWFSLANAGNYYEKFIFYPFKTRFLKAHAISDGHDLQVIVKKCWCGDGIFRGKDDHLPKSMWDTCWECGGTGIYETKHIVLNRWLLNGTVFHEPSTVSPHSRFFQFKERFDGLIQHAPVDSNAARQAMDRLLIRYEPQTLIAIYRQRARNWFYYKRHKVRNHLYRLNQRLRALSGKEVDEVPF